MTRPTSTIARRRPAERRRRPAKGSRHEVVLHGQHLSYLEAGRRSGGPTPLASLADPGTRGAFVQTTRAALDRSGQRLDGTGRLHLLADVPVLIVAGRQDACIPVEHSVRAHDLLPGSRLEVFEHAGHFPHAEHSASSPRRCWPSWRPPPQPARTRRPCGVASGWAGARRPGRCASSRTRQPDRADPTEVRDTTLHQLVPSGGADRSTGGSRVG
jgi:hypothetical protein